MKSVVSLSTAFALKIAGPQASAVRMTAAAAVAIREAAVQRSTTALIAPLPPRGSGGPARPRPRRKVGRTGR